MISIKQIQVHLCLMINIKHMIYAKITFIQNPKYPTLPEIYLNFFEEDIYKVNDIQKEWQEELSYLVEIDTNRYPYMEFNDDDKLVSLIPVFRFLAKHNFIPVTENFFYKK